MCRQLVEHGVVFFARNERKRNTRYDEPHDNPRRGVLGVSALKLHECVPTFLTALPCSQQTSSTNHQWNP